MRVIRFAALVVLVLALSPSSGVAADCQFVLGFKAIRDMIPGIVGECLENEHFNVANGDSLQRTSGGLLVWRKIDNWTAFTNGYETWVNGPNGLQKRLNTERFSWEKDPIIQPTPTPQAPTVTPNPQLIAECRIYSFDVLMAWSAFLKPGGADSLSAWFMNHCSAASMVDGEIGPKCLKSSYLAMVPLLSRLLDPPPPNVLERAISEYYVACVQSGGVGIR